ncbi:MAG: GNAT family N-acetyltransferase [Psychrilyobacter sp.]|nr:GNAT family N-acetyltransferase [Psychrilyobacter sp.]
MEFKEIDVNDDEYIDQIIEIEKEAFGENGGVDKWILKPLIKYGKVFVLVEDAKILGIAEFIRSFNVEEVFLYGFSIKKEYRQKGYGKKLLENSIEILKKNKIEKISLTTSIKNIKGIKLYEKIGFKKEEVLFNEYGTGVNHLKYSIKL